MTFAPPWWMRVQLAIALATVAACGGSGRPIGPGSGGKADGDSLRFYNPGRTSDFEVAGIHGTRYETTAEISDALYGMPVAYGGMFADAVQVDPEQLKPLLADETKLESLIFGGAQYLDNGGTVTNMSIDEMPRDGLLSAIYNHNAGASLAEWSQPDRDQFRLDLIPIVDLMIVPRDTRVFHVNGSPEDDWSTDAWASIDLARGVVMIVVQDGDI